MSQWTSRVVAATTIMLLALRKGKMEVIVGRDGVVPVGEVGPRLDATRLPDHHYQYPKSR